MVRTTDRVAERERDGREISENYTGVHLNCEGDGVSIYVRVVEGEREGTRETHTPRERVLEIRQPRAGAGRRARETARERESDSRRG